MNKSCMACEAGEWHLHVWNPADPQLTDLHVPWTCRSWRHAGECRRWKGAQDFARVAVALNRRPDWVYIVLTFPQAEWPNKWELYRRGVELWAKLRKRFVRRFGRMEYIQTWERHAKGGAHVNLVIANEDLFWRTCEDWRAIRRRWLRPTAMECGFGKVIWLKPMNTPDGLAGYFTKLSRELTGAGEKNQIPEDAPPHFRRIRSSAKTLPPVYHSEYTGQLLQCPVESWEKWASAHVSNRGQNARSEKVVNLDADECDS